MRVKYIAHQFQYEDEPHYIRKIKNHWWSKWKIDMRGNYPAMFRKRDEIYHEIVVKKRSKFVEF